jgi:arylformamidase
MIAQIQDYKFDLSNPIDISIPVRGDEENVRAWYVNAAEIKPVVNEHFTGSVKMGGQVNFRNVFFNPHGNGTHTECLGHISKEDVSINQCLVLHHFLCSLISAHPTRGENNEVEIRLKDLNLAAFTEGCRAIAIRTYPNSEDKLSANYSDTNPPYLSEEVMEWLSEKNIHHLLIDTPSVDREKDEGKLRGHHLFWEYPDNPQFHKTITELIYVSDAVEDGLYLLNLQVAAFENDAAPSRPVLYPVAVGV